MDIRKPKEKTIMIKGKLLRLDFRSSIHSIEWADKKRITSFLFHPFILNLSNQVNMNELNKRQQLQIKHPITTVSFWKHGLKSATKKKSPNRFNDQNICIKIRRIKSIYISMGSIWINVMNTDWAQLVEYLILKPKKEVAESGFFFHQSFDLFSQIYEHFR